MKSIPRGRPGEFGRNATGFTLIEISVVLFLIALMALLVMPSMMGLHVSRLKHESRRLAGRATFLYGQAAANKVVLRLTFNLDAQAYSVTRMDPHSTKPAFVPDLEDGAAPVTLPSDVQLRDVTVEGTGTVTRGTVSCNFYPEGYVDATVVHLVDPGGTVFTLTFQPLTGRVSIARGDIAPKVAQTQS
ncbi:MAG TPA: prepilin-type N-terminal cleavage/methylation domain-containing protein [Candidatus Binataceae bacterium]|jgi:prepilin-type N-terminal cleavage/methylation domain-containing protein|nr:prepilin-type N-terminal cleavage/methylation domain-containing protein [Candidatus Binataceae bacterium]